MGLKPNDWCSYKRRDLLEKTQRKACHVKMEAEIEVTCLWAKVCWQPCEAGSKAWNRPPQSLHREPTPPTPGFWEPWTPAQGANPFLLFSASFLVAATGNGQQAEDKATGEKGRWWLTLASGAGGHGGGQSGANLPNHELHLAFLGCLDENGDQLGVPWTKNAMRADGCGQEILLRIMGTQDCLQESKGRVWVADTSEF